MTYLDLGAAALGRPRLSAASVFLNGKQLPICLPAKGCKCHYKCA